MEAIEQALLNNRAIIFNHIRREGNKVADLLANVGVENEHTLITGTLEIISNHDQKQECKLLVQRDAAPRMRVYKDAFMVMGLEWVVKSRHLPALYSGASSMWREGHKQVGINWFKGTYEGGINATFTFARDV